MTRYNPEKDRAKMAAYKDAVLEEERMWIVEREQEGDEGKILDKGKGKANAVGGEAEEEQDGEGIECQCCFCEYPFVCAFIHLATKFLYLFRHLFDRQKWFNAQKPIFSVRLAYPNTPLPN